MPRSNSSKFKDRNCALGLNCVKEADVADERINLVHLCKLLAVTVLVQGNCGVLKRYSIISHWTNTATT